MSSRFLSLVVLVTMALTLAVTERASAHGLGGSPNLPIPQWLFAWAASIVLVVSFVALGALSPRPRMQPTLVDRRVVRLPRLLDPLLGLLGVAVFVGLVYAGLSGTSDPQLNVVPTVVYVAFWVAVPLLSALLGDVFCAVNPWRAVGRAAEALVTAVRGGRAPVPMPYPERLGYLPAVVGLVAFGWLELVHPDRDDPRTLALLALLYAVLQLGGMALFGVRQWTARGDAFAVYFALCARLSPLRWSRDGLFARRPIVGVADVERARGLSLLIVVLVGITTFDGISGGGLWRPVGDAIYDPLVGIGLSSRGADQIAGTIGLALTIALVFGLYDLGCRGMHQIAPRLSLVELREGFAHTLVPIALAYVLAHYAGLLAFQGQALGPLLSDPLGNGSDLLGTARWSVDYRWISPETIWYIQLAALLAGHVAGLWLAHRHALVTFSSVRGAVRSQYRMLIVMVTLTCLGLFLIA